MITTTVEVNVKKSTNTVIIVIIDIIVNRLAAVSGTLREQQLREQQEQEQD